ncbi:tripartite-type tricarboxylate transporter receptor subunit TctC [Bradyrhizobium sp. USDA 4502]
MASLRYALVFVAALLIVSMSGSYADAEDYPARPVRIIVPFGPGGSADGVARQIDGILQESFGQPFVVENRTGAGGVIGTLEIAKAETGRRAISPQAKSKLFGSSSPATLSIALGDRPGISSFTH